MLHPNVTSEKKKTTEHVAHGALQAIDADLVRVLNVCVRGVDGEGADGSTCSTSSWPSMSVAQPPRGLCTFGVDQSVWRALSSSSLNESNGFVRRQTKEAQQIGEVSITEGCHCRAQVISVRLFRLCLKFVEHLLLNGELLFQSKSMRVVSDAKLLEMTRRTVAMTPRLPESIVQLTSR